MATASGLVLRELDGPELAEYIDVLEAGYAADMHDNGGIPLEEARELSRRSTQELFPDGRPIEGSALWVAEDGDGGRIGLLWLARRDDRGGEPYAWVYDIEVAPERRGQGWGRLLLQRAEEVAREWGMSSLGLNVFGDNEIARSLYRSAGFREQQVTMRKGLG